MKTMYNAATAFRALLPFHTFQESALLEGGPPGLPPKECCGNRWKSLRVFTENCSAWITPALRRSLPALSGFENDCDMPRILIDRDPSIGYLFGPPLKLQL